jgi:hypothetical protein
MTELTLVERCTNVSNEATAAMVEKIQECVAIRDSHDDNGGLSWSNSKKFINNNVTSFARFLVATNRKPENIILNTVVGGKLFNAKALKKVVELARFGATGGGHIEMVMRAFIACSIGWSMYNQDEAISNKTNKNFLSGRDWSQYVKDADLADYLKENAHAFISGGKDTQSSQARRTLEVLGMCSIVDSERSRGGITLREDELFEMFSEKYLNA